MSIIGYARVSTVEQDTGIQVQQLKDAGAHAVYSEQVSGKAGNRAQLEAALKALRPGDTLLVTRLDRLGRNMADLIKNVQRITDAGANLKALYQQFDTEGPTGRLMMHILAVVAEFETDLRRERQMEGIAKARAEGKYDPSRYPIPLQKLSAASYYLRRGWTYAQVAEKTGISDDTLRRRFPNYGGMSAGSSTRAKLAKKAGTTLPPKKKRSRKIAFVPPVEPVSAPVEVVTSSGYGGGFSPQPPMPTPQPAPKGGFLSRILGR